MNQNKSRNQAAIWIAMAVVGSIVLIPASGAALPSSASSGLLLSGSGYTQLQNPSSFLSGYTLPKSPLLSQGYTVPAIGQSNGLTIPQLQGGTGTVLSSGSSSQLSGLFSTAMSNYYLNPPKPITNASPSAFMVPAVGSDATWDSLFNPPVYHGCGCG